VAVEVLACPLWRIVVRGSAWRAAIWTSACPAGRFIVQAMRMTRAHERTRIIMNSHTQRHAAAPPASAEPAGPTTRAETAALARATPKAASPSAGPAAFLAAHPFAYGLSLAGSGASAV